MKVLTVTAAADRLGVEPPTIRRYVHTGKLRASRPGNRLLIHEDSVDELLTATIVQPEPVAPRATRAQPPAPPARTKSGDRVSYRERLKRSRA